MANYNNYVTEDSKWKNDLTKNLPTSCAKTDSTEKSFDSMKGTWREYCSYWKSYPDKFIDFIRPEDCKIDLYFYQRVYLRILMRYKKVYITATRGTAKSFTEILAMYLKCIMYPTTFLFIVAPGKEQAAKISQENIEKIWEYYPILKDEIKYKSFKDDYTKLIFTNGSKLDVVQARNSTRGGRRNGGSIEEISDEHLDGDLLNATVIPLMANNRIAMCKGVDPDEQHKFQFMITTAGTKQSFAFKKLKEVLEEMKQGKSAFSIGNSYELPCMHNQLDIDFVNEQKESPSFNPLAFSREYESCWTGSSESSLVSLENLNQCRTLTKPEDKYNEKDKDAEYILSYDVARSEGNENAASALTVVKCLPKGDGTYIKSLVNIYCFQGTHFLEQALFLKKKVTAFKARILLLDHNGLGKGLTDQLVLDIDDNPPYYVVNDDRYDKYKLPNSIPMIYALQSQNKETRSSDIHNNFMQTITNHKLNLLKSSAYAKSDLIKDSKKNSEALDRELIPYIMTDVLCEEIMNLEYKQAGNETKVSQISKQVNKDKFSSLEYALYWIYLEEQKNKTRKKSNISLAEYLFYN